MRHHPIRAAQNPSTVQPNYYHEDGYLHPNLLATSPQPDPMLLKPVLIFILDWSSESRILGSLVLRLLPGELWLAHWEQEALAVMFGSYRAWAAGWTGDGHRSKGTEHRVGVGSCQEEWAQTRQQLRPSEPSQLPQDKHQWSVLLSLLAQKPK